MPVRIRLAPRGKKGQRIYSIVVADSRSPRSGRFIEKIGTYNPNFSPFKVKINHERAFHWLMIGAQPTKTAKSLLSKEGLLLKKHLQVGVSKGALTQLKADEMHNNWKDRNNQKSTFFVEKDNRELTINDKQQIQGYNIWKEDFMVSSVPKWLQSLDGVLGRTEEVKDLEERVGDAPFSGNLSLTVDNGNVKFMKPDGEYNLSFKLDTDLGERSDEAKEALKNSFFVELRRQNSEIIDGQSMRKFEFTGNKGEVTYKIRVDNKLMFESNQECVIAYSLYVLLKEYKFYKQSFKLKME